MSVKSKSEPKKRSRTGYVSIFGRPPKYTNKEELEKLIDKYFRKCLKNREVPTVTGLGLAVNLGRDALLDYGEKEEFSDTIARAKAYIHAETEQRLYSKETARGGEFSLKNNFKWRDRTPEETKENQTLIVNVTDFSKAPIELPDDVPEGVAERIQPL